MQVENCASQSEIGGDDLNSPIQHELLIKLKGYTTTKQKKETIALINDDQTTPLLVGREDDPWLYFTECEKSLLRMLMSPDAVIKHTKT